MQEGCIGPYGAARSPGGYEASERPGDAPDVGPTKPKSAASRRVRRGGSALSASPMASLALDSEAAGDLAMTSWHQMPRSAAQGEALCGCERVFAGGEGGGGGYSVRCTVLTRGEVHWRSVCGSMRIE